MHLVGASPDVFVCLKKSENVSPCGRRFGLEMGWSLRLYGLMVMSKLNPEKLRVKKNKSG